MRLALAQVVSESDPTANLAIIEDYAGRAAADGAEVVVFPEAMMRAFGNTLADIAEPLDGPWASAVRAIAGRLGITIIAGMFTPGTDGRVLNTLLVAGPGGIDSYNKIHLFDAFGFAESDSVDAGDRVVTLPLAGSTVGLATCYDIRFPALFLANAAAGAMVNIVCASWGAGSGKAEQWELLARARAVDTTTFVVAVGQANPLSKGIEPVGTAPTGIGHSMVVSPLGVILHQLGDAEELLVFDLDTDEVDVARRALPVLANRRTDLE
ncbi:MAG: Nitrilase/cyanide hydratase and apolipoprotein N-acyltransferase [Glaciihabitans sp.]|nr:Nitrilase/cyanide hydratase and apolipoprotein N-acyltransferase [Glaciihabitans sp.]